MEIIEKQRYMHWPTVSIFNDKMNNKKKIEQKNISNKDDEVKAKIQ